MSVPHEVSSRPIVNSSGNSDPSFRRPYIFLVDRARRPRWTGEVRCETIFRRCIAGALRVSASRSAVRPARRVCSRTASRSASCTKTILPSRSADDDSASGVASRKLLNVASEARGLSRRCPDTTLPRRACCGGGRGRTRMHSPATPSSMAESGEHRGTGAVLAKVLLLAEARDAGRGQLGDRLAGPGSRHSGGVRSFQRTPRPSQDRVARVAGQGGRPAPRSPRGRVRPGSRR